MEPSGLKSFLASAPISRFLHSTTEAPASREEEEDAAAAESRLSCEDSSSRSGTRSGASPDAPCLLLRPPDSSTGALKFMLFVPANRRSSSSDLAAASAADDDGFALPPMACRSPTGSWEINRTETRVSTMYSEVRRDKKHRQAKKGAAKTNPVCAKGLGMANAPAPIRRLNTKAKDTSEDADAPSTPAAGPNPSRAMSRVGLRPLPLSWEMLEAFGKMSFRGFSPRFERRKKNKPASRFTVLIWFLFLDLSSILDRGDGFCAELGPLHTTHKHINLSSPFFAAEHSKHTEAEGVEGLLHKPSARARSQGLYVG